MDESGIDGLKLIESMAIEPECVAYAACACACACVRVCVRVRVRVCVCVYAAVQAAYVDVYAL